MLEEASADDVHLGFLYSGAGVVLPLLLAKPGGRLLRNLVAELHQEHPSGYMGVALVVPPSKSSELYYVATAQTTVAEKYVLSGFTVNDGKRSSWSGSTQR